MGENVERLKEGYTAFSRGDLDAVLALAHEDVLWQGTPVEGVPGAGEHRGKEAITAMLGEIPRRWDELRLATDQFVEDGDTVVVLGHLEAKARATGRPVKVPFAHILTFEEGKVRRMTSLADTAIFVAAMHSQR